MIEDLPLKTRKAILFVSVFIISLAAIFFRISFFSSPAVEVKNSELTESFKKLSQDLGSIFWESKQKFAELKKEMDILAKISTSTPPISTSTNQSQIDIEKLEEELSRRLQEKVSTSTPTSTLSSPLSPSSTYYVQEQTDN